PGPTPFPYTTLFRSVPYSTCESDASSVAQLIVAELDPTLALDTALITGGALSTVTLTTLAGAVLPAASRAMAVKLWEPLATRVVFQEIAYGAAVTSAPRFAPSSLNCTPTTPTLSVALAETVTVPATVTPAAGAVIDTV